ncbi:F0F1-type ATP synthase membrane subunit c/vacuolar-type H+-ATPase subunit K [Streptacidiphilus sp. MAP12-16]|uniref:hypothetical protein n=1 Tax=Streptacidiphilus sp. MAP12-16 TaxID=3156300 RepID=UPI003511317B
MNKGQKTAVAILGAALAVGATACASRSTGATAGRVASGAASGAANAPSSAAGTLEGLSGAEIGTRAIADLKAASSVRMIGSGMDSGASVSWDLSLASGRGCTGKISKGSAGSFQIVVIGTKFWLKPDAAFWKAAGGSDPATLGALTGKYLETTTTNSRMASLADLCDVNKSLVKAVGDVSGLTKGIAVTVNGQKALAMDDASTSIVTVSDSATPEILRVTSGGANPSRVNLSDYNKPVTLTPPSSSEILDGAKFGM